MIIYFEDGPLCNVLSPQCEYEGIAAGLGPTRCEEKLDYLRIIEHEFNKEITVYTNYLGALDSRYSWDSNNKKHTINLRTKDKNWANIQNFTERELRFGHNIPHMYLNGVFKNEIMASEINSLS